MKPRIHTDSHGFAKVSAYLRLLMVFVAIASSGWAQVQSQLSGAVKDATGAGIPGASLIAKNTATGVNMPVESRRSASLVRLMGNIAFKAESGINQTPSFSMAGGRSQNQMWSLDGASVQDIALGTPQNMVNPPAEALQEFRAEANSY